MSYHDFDAEHWRVDLGGIRVTFGEGRLAELGEIARSLEGTRALLITDPGIEDAGHARRALESLAAAGIETEVFDGVEENPTSEHVEAGVEAARAARADLLIGLGGGSAMDSAKGINFLLTNGGEMEDYWGVGKAEKPMLPSIGIPTTAGTGSEAQSFALITHPKTHRKMACGDEKARFRAVVLDPELVSSQPRAVAAATAMDAVSHALESYVTRARNPISQLYAREAWRLLDSSFETFLARPEDRKARSRMLLGAHFSGAAIETSMLGAAHSCANPLTARYGVVHGVAVGLMLPHVVRFNGGEVDGLYGELTQAASLEVNGHENHASRLGERLGELQTAAGLPKTLDACGVEASALTELAAEAAEQWTAQFNPRSVDAETFRGLFENALGETS